MRSSAEVAHRGLVSPARAANCLFLFAGLVPIALVAWYVITQGSQVPVGDQWCGSCVHRSEDANGYAYIRKIFLS